MEIQAAIEDLDQGLSELTPHEVVEVLEDLYQALPMLIFLLKLSLHLENAKNKGI